MDKFVIGFIADLLYTKHILSLDEYEDICSSKNMRDLDEVIEKMLRGEEDDREQGYRKEFDC